MQCCGSRKVMATAEASAPIHNPAEAQAAIIGLTNIASAIAAADAVPLVSCQFWCCKRSFVVNPEYHRIKQKHLLSQKIKCESIVVMGTTEEVCSQAAIVESFLAIVQERDNLWMALEIPREGAKVSIASTLTSCTKSKAKVGVAGSTIRRPTIRCLSTLMVLEIFHTYLTFLLSLNGWNGGFWLLQYCPCISIWCFHAQICLQLGPTWPFQRNSRQPTPARGLLCYVAPESLNGCLTILLSF